MSALRQPLNIFSAEDYLRMERSAAVKHEYVNGYVYAMAGASMNHNRIVTNLLSLMSTGLRGRPCEAVGPDMKIRIDKANVFRYPDVSGLCGPVLFHDSGEDAYCNPAFIVEVLSPSSESLDRGEKFNLYRLLDSLTEYVLVRQDRVEVEVFSRQPDASWDAVIYNELTDSFRLLGVELMLAEVYEKVTFP